MIEFGIGDALYTATVSDMKPEGPYVEFTGPDGRFYYLAQPVRVQ
jgi:hypothetical protein